MEGQNVSKLAEQVENYFRVKGIDKIDERDTLIASMLKGQD